MCALDIEDIILIYSIRFPYTHLHLSKIYSLLLTYIYNDQYQKCIIASRCQLNARLREILVVRIRIFCLRSFESIHEILVAKEYQIPIPNTKYQIPIPHIDIAA